MTNLPSTTGIITNIVSDELFTLTHEEVIALYEYFIKRAGYISYEFDPLMIALIRRLNKEIEGRR